ncbi:MAG: HlyD family efflux transporter periplasmic adaptor subunit [Proteobacteria bacterium]|nr:HlyD family efflux transporter periplasmic adaptor subunit [Pseudomonadota bacterium]
MRLLTVFVSTLLLCACTGDNSVEALGTLERDRIIHKATANEIIIAQPIPEGTLVSAGSLLVQLDDRRQKAVVARAIAEVAKADALLEELRNGAREEDVADASARVAGTRATLQEAKANYIRAKELVAKKLAAQAALDSALAARDGSEAAHDSAKEQLLRLTNGTRPEQLAQAEASLHAAQAQLELEQYILTELSVVATRDGYLDSLPWNVGERVTTGATLALLLAGNKPYARVYIPEPWRVRLQVGDTKAVKVDGVDRSYTGHLRWIATDPAFTPYYALNSSDRARLVYLAEFDLDDADELPSGVPTQVILEDD